MEFLDPEGSTIKNPYPYGATCRQIMVFAKWQKIWTGQEVIYMIPYMVEYLSKNMGL